MQAKAGRGERELVAEPPKTEGSWQRSCLKPTTEHNGRPEVQRPRMQNTDRQTREMRPGEAEETVGVTAAQYPGYSRVIVSDTVDVVVHVHSEGHPVEALIAHGAPEAAWVVGLPEGLEDLGVGGTEGSVQVEGSAQPPE